MTHTKYRQPTQEEMDSPRFKAVKVAVGRFSIKPNAAMCIHILDMVDQSTETYEIKNNSIHRNGSAMPIQELLRVLQKGQNRD